MPLASLWRRGHSSPGTGPLRYPASDIEDPTFNAHGSFCPSLVLRLLTPALSSFEEERERGLGTALDLAAFRVVCLRADQG